MARPTQFEQGTSAGYDLAMADVFKVIAESDKADTFIIDEILTLIAVNGGEAGTNASNMVQNRRMDRLVKIVKRDGDTVATEA